MKFKIALVVCLLVFLSSCGSNLSKPDTAKSITTSTNDSIVVEEYNEDTADTTAIKVNGIINRNKFQGDLILQNLKYSEEVVLQNTIGKFHRVEGTKYDLLYNANSEVTGASESVYCRDDQWQELKKYYSDSNNFTYQCIVKNDNHSVEPIDVDKIDIVKLNELLVFCNENKYEPNSFAKTSKTKAVSTSSIGNKTYCLKISSNDGLFSADAESFSIVDSTLVYRYYEVMSENKTLIIEVPQDLSEYFVSVISNLDTK